MDPFTTLLNGVETYLKANACVKRALGGGIKNFIAYNKTRKDTLDIKAESDLPMVLLEPQGGPAQINNDGCKVYMDYTITAYMFTGEQNVTVVNPVLWAVLAAIISGRENTLLTAMTWQDEPFVQQVNVMSAIIGVPTDEQTPMMVGWTGIAAFMFRLQFSYATIRQFAGVTDGA